MNEPLVLTETLPATDGFRIGRIILNSPKTLNSLSGEILRLVRHALANWALDPSVACVWLEGAGGKAFCAGGDVKQLYKTIVDKESTPSRILDLAQVFFENEYRLDYGIRTYPKPIVLWGDGIVMGGGIGLLAGASHRIVTERTLMAMPEITIGLYPDVGASRFLTDMPGRLGLFLGLTASRFNGGDALHLGLADFYAASESKLDALKALQNGRYGHDDGLEAAVSSALRSIVKTAPASVLQQRQAEIDALMAGDKVEDIWQRWQGLSVGDADPLLRDAKGQMLRGSPTSLKITFEQWRRSKGITYPAAFQQELVLSLQCCLNHDFPEGVRALLVDKDNSPQWQPKTLEEITDKTVQHYFESPWDHKSNPLLDL